jgi:hypothetical protein
MGLHEIKKLLHNQRNISQIEEAAYGMASYTSDKGLEWLP